MCRKNLSFCELWYNLSVLLYWFLYGVGHVMMWALCGCLILLLEYYPYSVDSLASSSLLAFCASYLCAVGLPVFYILLRFERKELYGAIPMLGLCFLVLTLSITSIGLLSRVDTQRNSFYSKLMTSLKSCTRVPAWLSRLQFGFSCCGLWNASDISHFQYSSGTSTSSPPPTASCGRGCLDVLVSIAEEVMGIVYFADCFTSLSSIVVFVWYMLKFLWLLRQPMVILTGKVYRRTSKGMIVSYPEVDSTEAISVSSSN